MQKSIKHLFYVAAFSVALSLASCQKQDLTPTISFEKANEVVDASEEIAVKVVLSKAADKDLLVPFTFSSTSSSADAYETDSASGITIKAGESEGSFKIKNTGTELQAFNVTVLLGDVEGYKAGMNPQIVVAMRALEKLVYSFNKSKVKLAPNSAMTVTLVLTGEESGEKFTANTDMSFEIKYAGTAKAGTDFTLNSSNITIPAGSNRGTFTIKGGEQFSTQDPFPTLSLEVVSAGERFIAGAVSRVTVEFFNSTFFELGLIGTWKFTKNFHEEDDDAKIIATTEEELGQSIPYPVVNENDSFSIAYDDESDKYTFTPAFSGDLKRYFRECEISNPELKEIQSPISYKSYNAWCINFETVNFDFATDDSDLKAAGIYFVIVDNTVEIFLFCDEGTGYGYGPNFTLHSDFGGDLEAYGMKLSEFMGCIFSLHYQFTKAE
ncbi:MAG: hypothetical protein SO114_05940 [Candidatus Cryptobacteroides sp.]|nr:hypothetical protein [Candidatus Cryptobacteroides sp.]